METYNGHVRTPQDAILLFEACRIGVLPRVQRRLSEKERQQIKSGSVFVWDEREAGMRRWTDGKSWSASRVSGSFLTYREMEGKRGGSFPAAAPTPAPKRASGKSPEGSATGSDGEGPDGYRYKADGLMKQSFSITTSSGQHLHLISYFSRSMASNLKQPTTDPNMRHIRPPKNMYPESSVNESQSVPAVTRGPMPGSPYAPAPHQMGPTSPYNRAGPPPQQGYPQAYASPPPHGQQPMVVYYGHPGAIPYYAPGYPPQGHVLDGPPPPMRNTHTPYAMAYPQFPQGYPPHPQFVHAGHPIHPGHPVHHGHPGPQYAGAAPSVRPIQPAENGTQQHTQTSLPEPSVQLPAINATAPRVENKTPTPQPQQVEQQSQPAPDTTRAPSPARATTLTLGSILNSHENDAAGLIANNNKVADQNTVNKLNKVMFVR